MKFKTITIMFSCLDHKDIFKRAVTWCNFVKINLNGTHFSVDHCSVIQNLQHNKDLKVYVPK